jgi:hypothetical protein
MPTFVDFAGMNTLVSSSFDDDNLITSEKNGEFTHLAIPDAQELVGINLHRNGPYGFSSWKQIRASENPISRHHRETNKLTFIIQPGPVRNVLSSGELRVRDRYSTLYSYTEPAVCQKAHPLVWNVGRHFKDEDGNVDFDNPHKFSIISSYGNQQIGFANDRVNRLLNFDPDEEKTEYVAIKDMYLENGLNKQDSPLTYWEFLQYRETVFPKEQQQYVEQARTRPQFESFYRHNRLDRRVSIPLGYFGNQYSFYRRSSWPLDAGEDFLSLVKTSPNNIATTNKITRRAGVLQTLYTMYSKDFSTYSAKLVDSDPFIVAQGVGQIDGRVDPYPFYNRRITLQNSQSVSNPSGMEIYGTSSNHVLFEGNALWEAGANRQIKDEDGNYISAPKHPFYDTYENYVEEVRKYGKNYSVIPEFRMSSQLEDYKRTDGAIELDMFEVTGGISGSEDSSKSNFYEIYSNTDFMKSFELIDDDHKDFTNGKVLSLRCKAIKKFLPYEGFYPAQRTVDLAKRFYDSYQGNIKLYNANNVELTEFNYGKQMVMTPLFAPGVLFNTIKSGVAVDYPIITGSLNATSAYGGEYTISEHFNKRIPFEAIIEPKRYLADYKLTSNEPHPSGNLSASAIWDGEGDEFYSMMANNFTAEIPEFFLPNGQLSSLVSRKQKDLPILEDGVVYGMRIKMRKSMNKARLSVYHSGSSDKPYFPPQDIILERATGSFETFTMYSRPSAFGPPTLGQTGFSTGSAGEKAFLFTTSSAERYAEEDYEFSYIDRTAGFPYPVVQVTGSRLLMDSRFGYNFPFTPPYYHGEAWCDIWITGSGTQLTIKEIQNLVTSSYSRYDTSYQDSNASTYKHGWGPQSLMNNSINRNAVQLSSSLNIFGVGSVKTRLGGGTAGSLVVDTGEQEGNRWVIQTKFETPMLNFNHISGSEHLTLPAYGSGSVPRGMWHQYGRIPEENEGVFIQVGPIPDNYQEVVMTRTSPMQDLSEALGFSGVGTKLGRIASKKTISEAVVAVPFIEQEDRKKFFRLDEEKIKTYLTDGEGGAHTQAAYQKVINGEPGERIGKSVIDQISSMKKFIFPPSFDFINFDVRPVAMYVFEFSHTLSQQDLSDIWQNLPPDIAENMETAEVAITHPLLKKELLGEGGDNGNKTIEMPEKLKWMVFKVKQRAASNYFKKTVLRNSLVNTDVESGNATQDEFGATSAIQYNWPYDFFSLVEMVRLDAEVEFGNADFSDYTTDLPDWNAVQADSDKVEHVVGGLEDNPISNISPPVMMEEGLVDSEFIQRTADSFQRNSEVIASAGQSLVQGSIMTDQIENNLLSADVAAAGAELGTMRDLAQSGQSVIPMGVAFNSLEDFMATTGQSSVLTTMPADYVSNLQQSFADYQSMVNQYGVNSPQATNQLSTVNNLVNSFSNNMTWGG